MAHQFIIPEQEFSCGAHIMTGDAVFECEVTNYPFAEHGEPAGYAVESCVLSEVRLGKLSQSRKQMVKFVGDEAIARCERIAWDQIQESVTAGDLEDAA